MRPAVKWSMGTGAAAVAALAPLVLADYRLHLLIIAGIFAILALSLNLIVGYVGQLSLGHTAFYGVGAYASALLAIKLELPAYLGIPLAAVAGGALALLISLVVLRMREDYFVIVTLSFAVIFQLIVMNWVDLTNGPMGLVGIPRLAVGGFLFKSKASYYWLVLGTLILTIFLLDRLVNSRVGRAFKAMRENEPLAISVGVNPTRYARLAFVLAGALAAMAGALYVHYARVLTPDLLEFPTMVTMLVIVVIGGRGTLAGPVLGALIVTFLPEELRMAKDWRLPIFGVVLMAVTMLAPRGLMSVLRAKRGWLSWASLR